MASLAILKARGPLRHMSGIGHILFTDLRLHWVRLSSRLQLRLGATLAKIGFVGYTLPEVTAVDIPCARRMEVYPLAGGSFAERCASALARSRLRDSGAVRAIRSV